jgi:hypothetical protein
MQAVRGEGGRGSKEGIGEQEGKTAVGVYRKKEKKIAASK